MHGAESEFLDPFDALAEPFPDLDPGFLAILRQQAQQQADDTGRPYEVIAARLARIVAASESVREAGRRSYRDPTP